jgi:alkaline phosphatase
MIINNYQGALLALLTFTLTAPCASAQQQTSVKNIIMIVGDGMGPAYTSAYRYFRDNAATPDIEQTVFDRILVGRASTSPASISGYVTDSAAAATALSTGYKTYNGAIGMDVNKQPQQSVLEFAKSINKSTGIVVTSQINHATPASYLSHVKSRDMYNDIADQYFDRRINGHFSADIMLGGGKVYFNRDDRDLSNEFSAAGFQYLDKYQGLSQINSPQVLGLFADKGLPWALDDEQSQRLKTMTIAAIRQLSNNKNGFFLLIEASQIDWAGHANDIAAAMAEMDDLSSTVTWLETFVASQPNTLVVMTADHSTGGLTIGANDKYQWTPDNIKNLSASPETIANQQNTTDFDGQQISQQLGFSLTSDELKILRQAHAIDSQALTVAIRQLIDVRTNTGWTTKAHTAVDAPVFAFGAEKERFSGQIDNTDIAKTIFKLLGK